jgi:RNA recognition motif-containing protein
LKDLFRSAGNIVRADINIGADGRAKGSGTVIFETSKDAQQAISTLHNLLLRILKNLTLDLAMFNSYEWYGRVLEVREVGSYISPHGNLNKLI